MRAALFCLGLIIAIGAAPALANQTRAASNGISVSIEGDDFSPSFTAVGDNLKTEDSTSDQNFYLFAARKMRGTKDVFYLIQGAIFYSGDWRFYNSAYFRGGIPAKYTSGDRNVVSCAGGSCSVSEGFTIILTATELTKYCGPAGLQIQIQAKNASTFLVTIPKPQLDAVTEIGKTL